MAVLSSLFNIGTQYPSAPPQGTSINSQKLAEEISPFYKDLLAKSQALYNQQTEEGYTPYQAPTMAQFSPEQQQSFAGIQGLVGSQKPVYDEAMALTRGTTRRFTPETAQALMNPYQQAVTDVEKRNIQENYENTILPELRAGAAMNQPYGGSRQAILEGMASDSNQRLLADAQAKGSLTAYNDAQSLFANQINREGAAASQLPTLASASYKTQAGELGALQAVGEEKQKQTQSALDEAYRNYLEEKRFPETSMNQYQAIIQGFPALKQDITRAAPPPQPSMANQLIGGLGTLGSLYGAYGGFSDGGFGSALPGYGPVSQKEGSGATTILPRQNAGMANPNDPRYDMSFEDPNMIGEVEQNRLMESQRLQELELMSDPSVLENQYRAAMIAVNGGTSEERIYKDRILNGARELGIDMQPLIDEVRANNKEERSMNRQEFIGGMGDKVNSGLQNLQEVLGARNIIPRQSGGPASGAMIKYNYPRSQHKGPVPIGSSFSDDVKGGLVPVNLPIQRQNVSSSFQTPTPVAAPTTQPNTQLLPANTTNRVDPRRQPAYTGVIGSGGLVDITDDGLQVFQKTQQGILNRSLYGGVLEGGNPALAATPIEETTSTPAAPMSPTIAGMLERSPLQTTDSVGSYGSTLPKSAIEGTDLYNMPSVQSKGGIYSVHDVVNSGMPLTRPSDAPETIVNTAAQTKYRDPQTGKIPYGLYVPQPINTFGQGYDLKDVDYFTANALASKEGAQRFMYNNEYARTDPGLLSNYDYSRLGTKPFAGLEDTQRINEMTTGMYGSGRGASILQPQNPNDASSMRAKGYTQTGRGGGWQFTGIKPYVPPTGRSGYVGQLSAGGPVIARKGGGLVDLPVVKRQQNATVLSPQDQALVNTYNNSSDFQLRAKIRDENPNLELGWSLSDRGTVFTGINNKLNSIYDFVTKLKIPDNLKSEVDRILFKTNYRVENLDDMEENLKKVLNVNEVNPALSGSMDTISGKKQQAFVEGKDTPPIQKYEKAKQVIKDVGDLGVDTTMKVGASLASLLETSINNKKETTTDGKKETDNATLDKNKDVILNESLEANNAALNLLDQNGLLNKNKDSGLLNYKNRLTDALANSKNKNAAVVKAIKAQDKRIKDRINQAPEAIRMEIFARMAQGFASMATSASPPAQAFLEQIPSFVEDTTAIGRGERERIDNLEDLSIESARAEAALADSEFTQETAIAAFELDQADIQQKRDAALIESVGMEAYSKASDFIKDVVGMNNNAIYGNARIALIEHVLRNGPNSLTSDVVNQALSLSPKIPKVEKQSILERIKGLVK